MSLPIFGRGKKAKDSRSFADSFVYDKQRTYKFEYSATSIAEETIVRKIKKTSYLHCMRSDVNREIDATHTDSCFNASRVLITINASRTQSRGRAGIRCLFHRL